MNPIHKCSCGRKYTAIEWAMLRLLGTECYEWGEIHELRKCVCGSTRVVLISEGECEEEAA